jgi:hypothetical protein
MATQKERLERIEEVLVVLKGSKPGVYLTGGELEVVQGELEMVANGMRKRLDFYGEAKRRREGFKPMLPSRPMRDLTRRQGTRDPSELPEEIKL